VDQEPDEVEITLPDGRTMKTTTRDFYDEPRPRKGNRIEVQYGLDGRDVYAREAGIGPNLARQWGWTATGGVSALVGGVLLIRRRRGAVVDQYGDAVEDSGQAEGEGVGGVDDGLEVFAD